MRVGPRLISLLCWLILTCCGRQGIHPWDRYGSERADALLVGSTDSVVVSGIRQRTRVSTRAKSSRTRTRGRTLGIVAGSWNAGTGRSRGSLEDLECLGDGGWQPACICDAATMEVVVLLDFVRALSGITVSNLSEGFIELGHLLLAGFSDSVVLCTGRTVRGFFITAGVGQTGFSGIISRNSASWDDSFGCSFVGRILVMGRRSGRRSTSCRLFSKLGCTL